MLDTTTIFHLVKPQDLNHHDTLFAGRMAEWLVEASFIAATRLVGSTDAVHCVQIHDMLFRKPFVVGDVVELRAEVAHLGRCTITVHGTAMTRGQEEAAVTLLVTFITVGDEGKAREHGYTLPPEYVTAHRDICELASSALARGGRR